MKNLTTLLLLLINIITCMAQEPIDSAKVSVKKYTARNFMEERTFNLYWETSTNHDYTLRHEGNTIDQGRLRNSQDIMFSAVLPVVDKGRYTLKLKGYTNFHLYDTDEYSFMPSSEESALTYYKVELNASTFFNISNKQLMLRGSFSIDGWQKGFGTLDGRLTALLVLRNNLYVGLHFMALYEVTPTIPLIMYTSNLNEKWSADISIPSRIFMRYQPTTSNRLSAGMVLDSKYYYCQTEMSYLPKTTLFKITSYKIELDYEHIIKDHLYFIAKGGLTKPFNSGFFKKNRKGNDDGDPLVEYSQPMIPFFYLGFSYNL